MNRDSLIYLFIIFAVALPALAQDSFSTLVDPVATLDLTTVEAGGPDRTLLLREAAVQQAVTPRIETRTVASAAADPRRELLPSVDSVTGPEIRTLQRRELGDVLRQTAGVHLVQAGQTGAQSSLFVRGMESNHAVVLLNGRRLPPGLAGLYQLEYLDVATLESVQISRGAASSLYGSDALGGAIDLRSTDARFVSEDTLDSFVEAGSFATVRSGHRLSLRDGRLGLALDTSLVETDNDRPRSAFENGVLRGSVAYELGGGVHFDLLGYLQDSFLEVPGSSLSPFFPETQLNRNQSSLVSPRFSLFRDDWELSAFYSHTRNELEATRDVYALDNRLFQSGNEFETVLTWRPSAGAAYTAGLGYYDYSFEREPLIPGPSSLPSSFGFAYASAFAQAELELPSDFGLLVSGRHDEHDSFSSRGTWTAQLDRRIEATGTTLFAKAATGYKAPSGQDFVFLAPNLDPSTLRPEESLTREIGFRQALFNPRSSLAVTYFENDVDGLIDVDPFTFVDPAVVDARSSGVEVEAVVSPCEGLRLYANATWLDTEILAGQYLGGFGGGPGDRLPRRPGFALAGGLVAEGDRWKAGAEVTGARDRYDAPGVILDDYAVARLFGSFEWSDRLELYGRIENVLVLDYETTRGFEAAGLGAFVGARYVFGN